MQEAMADGSSASSKHFRERTLRTLKLSLGRLWKRRSVTITEYDPTYKVAYLGNVLTGWAKGEGCVEKPLSTLWKNYTGSSKPDVQMKLTVTQAGLKAVTKEHGLTEYWSHRVTYCAAPSSFPRVFCWVYRHEGRKLKQELRCHAVLCPKEAVARRMASQLRAKLAQALSEFKRDKVCRQNARLSLANSVYDNPSLPRRKILLSTGSHNYRPPLERSKSAPKLMVIEESLEEEVEDEDDEHEHASRRYQSTRVLNARLDHVVESETYEDNLDEEVLRLHQKMKEIEEVAGSDGEDVLNRISDQGGSEGRESYQQIMSIITEHQENMDDERELALGNHREGKSCFGSSRYQGSQPKRVGWNLEPVKYSNNKYQTERLLIIGDQIRGSSNQNILHQDENILNRESESDEGSNSLQSISSSGSSDTSTATSRVTEYTSSTMQLNSIKGHTSLPYMYQEAQEAPSPNDSIVDWRPAAGTLKRLRDGAKVDLDGLTVALRRSATFPPPTQLSVEALELDSLSEEDDAIEEAVEHEREEDNLSDESGYAELIDVASKDDFMKVQHSAMASTRCVQV